MIAPIIVSTAPKAIDSRTTMRMLDRKVMNGVVAGARMLVTVSLALRQQLWHIEADPGQGLWLHMLYGSMLRFFRSTSVSVFETNF